MSSGKSPPGDAPRRTEGRDPEKRMRTQVQHHSLQRKSGNSPNVERMSQLWSAHAAGRRLALERNEAPTHGTARPSLARFSSQATPGIGDSPEVESRSQKLGGEGTASDCRWGPGFSLG